MTHYLRSIVILVALMIFLVGSITSTQISTVVEDDFDDNSNMWTEYTDDFGYSRVEDGAYVFNFDSRADFRNRFVYPFSDASENNDLSVAPPITIRFTITEAMCPAGGCLLRVVIGNDGNRITYIEYNLDDEQAWLYSIRASDGAALVPIDFTNLRDNQIVNIFDGQPHEIVVTARNNGANLRIDNAGAISFSVESNEMDQFRPIGNVGFGMDVESFGGSVYAKVDDLTIGATSARVEPTPTPLPPTAIPTPTNLDANLEGFSYEILSVVDGSSFQSIELSSDGETIVLIDLNTVTLIPIDGEQPQQLAIVDMPFARTVAFPLRTNTILVGGGNLEETFGQGMMTVFDLATSEATGTILGIDFDTPEEGAIDKLQIINDMIIASTELGVLKFWDETGYLGAITHNDLADAVFSDWGVRDFDFSDDESLLATGGSDNRIVIWDADDLSQSIRSIATPNVANPVVFRPNSAELLYTSCDDRSCTTGTRVLDADTGDEVFALDRAILDAQYTNDGQYIVGNVVGEGRRGVAFFDADNGTFLGVLDVFEEEDYLGISDIAFGPVEGNTIRYYARYCTQSDFFGCSRYNLLTAIITLP